MSRALIIDQSTGYAVQVCRDLAAMGVDVAAFAEPGAPIHRSRFCRARFASPPWYAEAFPKALGRLLEDGAWDVAYMCSEQILERIVPHLVENPRWCGLPLTSPVSLRRAFSKNAMQALAASVGVACPRSVVPRTEAEVVTQGATFPLPLIVKGDKGGASQHLRVVHRAGELLPRYREVLALEAATGGWPALQEFVPGPTYSIGGLFDRGRPLRVIAHRRLLMYPPDAGHTVKGVTERPAALLDAAFALFARLEYTGLGHMDFVRDARDGQFRFLEINPRVWGSIGFGRIAGVDFHTPYRDLARGRPVVADLAFRVGVVYRRIVGDLRLVHRRPARIMGFLGDFLDPRVHSDLCWRDLRASLPARAPHECPGSP